MFLNVWIQVRLLLNWRASVRAGRGGRTDFFGVLHCAAFSQFFSNLKDVFLISEIESRKVPNETPRLIVGIFFVSLEISSSFVDDTDSYM